MVIKKNKDLYSFLLKEKKIIFLRINKLLILI